MRPIAGYTLKDWKRNEYIGEQRDVQDIVRLPDGDRLIEWMMRGLARIAVGKTHIKTT